MTVGGELGQEVLQAVQGLGVRMDKLEMWMERLGAEFVRTHTELKAEIQQVRTELKTEIQDVRTELKLEMQAGFRLTNSRIDSINEALVAMNTEIHRTTQRQESLQQRVQAVEARTQHP